jgi:hypothetical protein
VCLPIAVRSAGRVVGSSSRGEEDSLTSEPIRAALSRPPHPMAASELVASWIDGPVRRLRIAHRSRLAWSLADDAGRVAFCVMFPGAVRLPSACAVAPQAGMAKTPSSLSVGDGLLAWGDDECDGEPEAMAFRVARWWRPARPDPTDHQALAPAVDPAAVRRLTEDWADHLGGGPGLTPYADDVLCGALVTLSAAGHPALPELAREISAADLEGATTATSASLLRQACEGWCIDELADLLHALARDEDPMPARAALLRVGSSSGRGLVEGVTTVVPAIAGGLLSAGRAA